MSDDMDKNIKKENKETTRSSKEAKYEDSKQDDKPFYEKVNEFNNGDREENPFEEIPKWKLIGGIVAGIASLTLSILFSMNGSPGLGMIFLSLPIVIPLMGTETGREFIKIMKKEMDDSNQEQQQSTQSKPKRICSDCGWQNPQENKFCHDCGSELINSG